MMTPVREFLYFLAIIVVLGTFLYLTGNQNPQPALQRVQPVAVDSVKQEKPTKIQVQKEAPILAESAEKSTKLQQQLFNPTTLVFVPDDSTHFQYLWNKLQHPTSALPVRVIYFGDSQVENDRITSSLREALQQKFGGKGPGLVPLDQYYNTPHHLMIELSDGWKIKSFQDEDFVNQSLLFKNTILTPEDDNGWFRIQRFKRRSAKPDYQIMKLYYWAKDTSQVTVQQGRTQIYAGTLKPEQKVSTLDFQFNRTPDDIRFDFKVKDTLNICGLSLESDSGIFVDNVALRGLSYPTFEWSDQEKLKQILDQLNVGLFVLHFGVNLVPYESDDYPNFKRHFQRQIDFLKRVRPDVPILIVGVSDMAEKQDGRFISYPNIPTIKAIQREISGRNHTAFWDLQKFMGGAGGMVNWVNAKPALGRTDYTHFSRKGADAIGKELGKLILNELKTEQHKQ
ncbi:MAG TPA: hypothetical protein VKA27_10365 [Sunxiuqinia sp.]|nr:hypothetical protein [Sunxiuqinia sp.]